MTAQQKGKASVRSLTDRECEIVAAASDHLMKMYGHEALSSRKRQDERAECYHHARALDALLAGGDEPQSEA